MGKYSFYQEIDPDFEAIEPMVKIISDGLWSEPLEEMRQMFLVGSPKPQDLPSDISAEITEFAARDGVKVPVKIYKASDVKPEAALFYVMHGGGWTLGAPSTEDIMSLYVAGLCKAVVVSVDYRMGPENKYPHAVNDSFDGLQWCIAHAADLSIDPKRIFVGGASAGGNLATVMALKARDEGLPGTILGQVLNIPVTCHPIFYPKEKYPFDSWEENRQSAALSAPRMSWFWEQYLGGKVEPEAYHSPLLAESLEELPPALIQIAGMDPLRDEAIAYGDALKAAGVETRVEIFGGVPHGFGGMVAVKKSKTYQKNVVDFINQLQSNSKL